jgi:hypothetical protein
MMSVLPEDILDQELAEQIGYTKYDEYIRSNYLKKLTAD